MMLPRCAAKCSRVRRRHEYAALTGFGESVAWALVAAEFALLQTRQAAKTRSHECERWTQECVRHGCVRSKPSRPATVAHDFYRTAACNTILIFSQAGKLMRRSSTRKFDRSILPRSRR